MAEVAGLVLGGVALISLFKDCVDLLSYVSAAQSLGHDADILNTKLHVEKTLLLQWADRVRLVGPDYDRRLDNRNVNSAVFRILRNLEALLVKSQELQARYGLRQAEEGDAIAVAEQHIGGLRLRRFIGQFDNLVLRNRDSDSRRVSTVRTVRWVVGDKDKFEKLIQELSYFNSKLNDLLPDTQNAIRAMIMRDINDVASTMQLKLLVDASAGQGMVGEMANEAYRHRITTKRILDHLWFRTMNDRREGVADAHPRTFHWALTSPSSNRKWDDLPKWLESGSGIYWISGKAGSGKSTLMKYLLLHQRTKDILGRWATGSELTVASFFFWYLGTPQQKSLEGLCRALLYNVLESDPTLVPELLPTMWREASVDERTTLDVPSISEVRIALRRLHSVGQDRNPPRKFCFLIDGLDEFSGDYNVGISILNLLVGPNVKLLVSSRPITACVAAFSGYPHLQMQDLTQGDIQAYIDDTIFGHDHMSYLRAKSPEEALQIRKELVEKSAGVFLWVVLACRSLISGFAAGDYFSDLRKRIDALPPELEDLFQHILSKIEPLYQNQAAKLLGICYESMLIHGTDGVIPALGLALIDEKEMCINVDDILHTVSETQRKAKCSILEGRLRSRCGGLLEISATNHSPSASDESDAVFFLHRTVFDFLKMEGVWSFDCLRIYDDDFGPSAILAYICLMMFEVGRESLDVLRNLLMYGRHSDKTHPGITMRIVSRLGDVLHPHLQQPPGGNQLFLSRLSRSLPLDPSQCRGKYKPTLVGVALAIEADLVQCLKVYTETISLQSLAGESTCYSPLYHALFQPLVHSFGFDIEFFDASSDMMEFLLSMGANPNELSWKGAPSWMTVWQQWLEHHFTIGGFVFGKPATWVLDMTMILLRHGADPTVTTTTDHGEQTLEQVIRAEVVGGNLNSRVRGKADEVLAMLVPGSQADSSANSNDETRNRQQEPETDAEGTSGKRLRWQ